MNKYKKLPEEVRAIIEVLLFGIILWALFWFNITLL
jgi:hypothetical protein